eukprot:6565073-Prymnesium_polylepis.1
MVGREEGKAEGLLEGEAAVKAEQKDVEMGAVDMNAESTASSSASSLDGGEWGGGGGGGSGGDGGVMTAACARRAVTVGAAGSDGR